MRRILVFALLAAGCKTVSVPIGLPVYPGGGAAAATTAIEQFMAAANQQDVQSMLGVWGDETGPARDRLPRSEAERSAIVMICHLRGTTFKISDPIQNAGGRVQYDVSVTQGGQSATSRFTLAKATATQRWFVQNFDITVLQNKGFCKSAGNQRP